MYMARLAALKEFAYMKALADEGFPVPQPIDQNRHCVVMSFVDGVPLHTVRSFKQPQLVLERLMRLVVRLARAGIVHGDFNEFNLMILPDEKITLIDFPQIIHLKHLNAKEQFDRDVSSTCNFFRKRMNIEVEEFPRFEEVLAEIAASGEGTLADELKIEGMRPEDSALLVSAHQDGGLLGGRNADGGDDDEGCNDDDSTTDEEGNENDVQEDAEEVAKAEVAKNEVAEADADVGLVPDAGREALGEDETQTLPVDDADIIEPAFKTKLLNPKPTIDKEEEKEDKEDAEESSDAEHSDAPGQITIEQKKKTRRQQTAKEARKNLQKQQKTKPAKPNNAKNKELRKGRHEV